jgi:hypothetical protein
VLHKIDHKIQDALSSLSREQYKVVSQTTSMFLIRGSIYKIEINVARKGQIATHKRKLNARKSLQKGGSILASNTLDRSKKKRWYEADEKLRKARKAIIIEENKAKRKLHKEGV